MKSRTNPPIDDIRDALPAVDVALLQTLFDQAPDVAFFVKDAQGRYVAVNDSLVMRHGLKYKSDVLGKCPRDICPGDSDILDVLTGLDLAIRVAITSNLSSPLLEFVKHVSPERVINVTASFHPMENGTRTHPMNPEIFVGRCLFLQNHGFNVTVNLVAWPEQMYLIPAWAEMFRAHSLRFHVDPYSSIAYYPYEYSEAERQFLEPWIWENRRAGLESVKPDAPITVLCSGGVDHINVQPDGSAWRCILERQLGLNPLGNIFDPGFRLFCLESLTGADILVVWRLDRLGQSWRTLTELTCANVTFTWLPAGACFDPHGSCREQQLSPRR
ncbi:MAG: hypothetical protein ACYC6N_07225 [Pirellulaceae bacterium]